MFKFLQQLINNASLPHLLLLYHSCSSDQASQLLRTEYVDLRSHCSILDGGPLRRSKKTQDIGTMLGQCRLRPLPNINGTLDQWLVLDAMMQQQT